MVESSSAAPPMWIGRDVGRPSPLRAETSSIASRCGPTSCASSSPFAVRVTPPGSRVNRANPSSFSSVWMCDETVGWETPRSWAARLSEPVRETVTNVRRWSRLGAVTRTP